MRLVKLLFLVALFAAPNVSLANNPCQPTQPGSWFNNYDYTVEVYSPRPRFRCEQRWAYSCSRWSCTPARYCGSYCYRLW